MSTLTAEDYAFYQSHGYLVLRNFFDAAAIIEATNEIEAIPEQECIGKYMKYFEVNKGNERKLCRVENFADFNEKWDKTIHDPRLTSIIEALLGESCVLYKEKINFKFPMANGFSPHQDFPAYTEHPPSIHMTALISIDDSTQQNGCLQFVHLDDDKDANRAVHDHLCQFNNSSVCSSTLDTNADKTIRDDVNDILMPFYRNMETKSGDVILFNSFLPHKSEQNMSTGTRRLCFATYNKESEGRWRDNYYADKRKVFPPDIERDPNVKLDPNNIYNIGNPLK
jgi:2-aminoethylphosphonate dioxygenase